MVPWWCLHPEALVGMGSAVGGYECPEVIPGYGAEALDTLCGVMCGVIAHTERRHGGNDKCTHHKCIHTHRHRLYKCRHMETKMAMHI